MWLKMNRQVICVCAGGLFAFLLVQVAQAFPSRGGNCAYCHESEEGTLDIQGYNLIEMVDGEDTEVFTVAPGGSTKFTIEAVAKGDARYGIILNRLDLLNEEVQYTPRLYTPDPDWSSVRGDHEYLYWYGRYYSTGLTEDLQTYEFDLTIDSAVKPGLYTLLAVMAGGHPSIDTGWTTEKTFALRVVPEPASLVLLAAGVLAVGSWRRRATRRPQAVA
jgi:hypothetical protein